MRSRYSAFVKADRAYLQRTWHPRTKPRRIHLGDDRTWLGLEVVSTSAGGLLDSDGTVEFIATHRQNDGSIRSHHEVSEFTRLDGAWVYVIGAVGSI